MGAQKGKPSWNAGTSQGWVDKRGYKWVYITENGKRRARREHRVIMEQHLRRKLEPMEVVHHKDGNTANNDIANLELIEFGEHSTKHHTGTRRNEYTKRTMEVMAQYREELKHVRSTNAELLEAAKATVLILTGGIDEKMEPWAEEIVGILRATIAKATGK